MVGHLHDRDIGTEAAERLTDLETDRSPAEHDHRRRKRLGFDRVAVGPVRDRVQTGDRGDRGASTRRDHYRSPCRVSLTIDFDLPGADETRLASEEGPALALEALNRDLVVPVIGRLPRIRFDTGE